MTRREILLLKQGGKLLAGHAGHHESLTSRSISSERSAASLNASCPLRASMTV